MASPGATALAYPRPDVRTVSDDRLSRPEAVLLSLMAVPATVVVTAYVADLVGLAFRPLPMAGVALVTLLVTLPLVRAARPSRADGVFAGGLVVATLAWLLWLARPFLLPLATGPDITHHLMLIEYIETHWRLVHDAGLERFLGEMAQYTPGSHILAALAGAWSGTDGTRALHTVQATLVALKVGFLFFIVRRGGAAAVPRALTVAGVLLLLAAPRYALGAFAEYGFVAQVVAEAFVVAMWWAVVAWDGAPDWRLAMFFSLCGAAAFLTWPVYVGPPVAAFGLVLLARRETTWPERVRHLAAALLPFAIVAGLYLVPRLGWLAMAGTGGDAPWPSPAVYSWPLTLLAVVGAGLAATRRASRATWLFGAMVAAQALSLYVLSVRRGGGAQPYMAQKMAYLLLWPMVALAALALGDLWTRVAARRPRSAVWHTGVAWGVVAVVLGGVTGSFVWQPKRLRPLPPALTSLDVYDAARWARAHLPVGCIEYLVGDDETSYWLHLAVLGNPRMSARTADWATYEPKDAILRWLTPGGLPYAVADLPALPRGVREELDVAERFGSAAIVRRRGPASCDAAP